MNKKSSEHTFTVEMNSEDHLKLMALDTNVTLIEGSLGELRELNFVEGVFLEVKGNYGTLRVDLAEEELRPLFHHANDKVVSG